MKDRSRLRNQEGFTLFSAFLLLILMFTLASGSMVYSTLDLRSTTHYDTGNQALYAAEAGLVHSLTAINTIGVMSFNSDIATRWSTVFGTTTQSVPGHSDVEYQVTVTADNTNATTLRDKGTLTSTGFAPMGAKRVLKVKLERSGIFGSPGALYLAADAVTSQFVGTSFDIDGNNHGLNGTAAAGDQTPGISTRNDAVTSSVNNTLSDGQKLKVKGLGYSASPVAASLMTTGGPGVIDLARIVSTILSAPGVVNTSTHNFNGNDTFGTVAAPQITHMTANDVTINGNASGAGILIVDGDLKINGTLDFIGWILVSGNTVIDAKVSQNENGEETWVLGQADILGSLWTGDLKIKIGGNAAISYCRECMQLAGGIDPTVNLIPQPMSVVSWEESL